MILLLAKEKEVMRNSFQLNHLTENEILSSHGEFTDTKCKFENTYDRSFACLLLKNSTC